MGFASFEISVVGTVGAVAAIIRSKNDQCIIYLAEGIQLFEDASGGIVHVFNTAVILGLLHIGMAGGQLGRRCHALMRFVKADVEEKRFLLIAMLVEPFDGFIGNDLTGVTLDLSKCLAVADKIIWVVVGRLSVVARCQPIVVTVISRVGASRLIGEPVAEMPFANMCSRVAAGLEEFSNRGFLNSQMHFLRSGDPAVDPGAHGKPACL